MAVIHPILSLFLAIILKANRVMKTTTCLRPPSPLPCLLQRKRKELECREEQKMLECDNFLRYHLDFFFSFFTWLVSIVCIFWLNFSFFLFYWRSFLHSFIRSYSVEKISCCYLGDRFVVQTHKRIEQNKKSNENCQEYRFTLRGALSLPLFLSIPIKTGLLFG